MLRSVPTASAPQHIAIVGAGVVGMATAWAIARRGCRVTVIDRAAAPASGASFANGAQLSYLHTDALASPGILHRLPALALGLDPAFSLHPSLDSDRILWLLSFLGNATAARFRANTLAGLQLGLESRLALQELLRTHPLDFAHRTPGKIVVYEDREGFEAATRVATLKAEHGGQQFALSPAEAITQEPALAHRPGSFAGAILSPEEEVGDPHRFCTSLATLLRDQYGTGLRLGGAVQSYTADRNGVNIAIAGGEHLMADKLVLCAGIETGELPGTRRLRRALMPMKGYSLTAPPGAHPPRLSITDAARKIVFCPLGGQIRIAGLAQLGRADPRVDPKGVAKLAGMATAALPEAADYAAAGQGWAGIRPMTANSLPILRRLAPRVAVNAGHGMLGWTFAMGAAERTARMILEDAE